jgi:organic radical activating enzyme
MKQSILVIALAIFLLACDAQSTIKTKKMYNNLFTEFISADADARTVLLFGGNPERRHEIIELLQPLKNVSVHGALSEEEGMELLQMLPKVDVVLIGGRYTDEQRIRIRSFIFKNYPEIRITEPGVDYPYSNDTIFTHIQYLIIK